MRRRPDLDDLDREIRDHIDAETLDNIACGMSETDARAAALKKFGNITRVKEDVRDVWVWADHLRQDVRDVVRRIRRNPGFAAAIISTLATLALALIAFAACVLPARRAERIDPIRALRTL